MSGSNVRVPVIWINGPEAVGKSTVGFAIFRELSDAGIRAAFIDLDQVNLCYPPPDDDPFNYGVRAAGLAAVWATFREEGVRCLVISGIAENQESIDAHTEVLSDAALDVVRLRAGDDELKRRFIARGGQASEVAQVVRVAKEMDRDLVGDMCVDTDGLSPMDTADLVRAAIGAWPWLT